MAEEVTAGVTDISGTVERITYRNQSNSYTVAEVKLPGETVTVVAVVEQETVALLSASQSVSVSGA